MKWARRPCSRCSRSRWRLRRTDGDWSGAVDWDTGTSRLLATHDAHQVCAVASSTAGDCLLSYDPNNPQNWVVGCGTAGPLSTTGPTVITTTFDPDGVPEDTAPGWTRLTPEPDVTGT